MTNLEIKLTDEQFQGALSAALLATLTPDMREDLIKQAITYLTTPREFNTYGKRNETPLREAVDQACRQLAYDVAKEHITGNPQVRDAYKAAMTEAVAELLTNRDGMRRVLSGAMVDAIAEDKW